MTTLIQPLEQLMTDTDPRRAPDPRFRGARDLPSPREQGVSRFLGGSPVAVLFRLILLSVLAGVVLAAIGFDPWNIVDSIQRLFRWIWELGFDAISGLWRYFLLGAVIVIPLWLISRLLNAPRGR